MALVIAPIPINVPIGRNEVGPWNIPDVATVITLRLGRFTASTPLLWTLAGTIVNAELHLSLDGGASYQFFCGMGSRGGSFSRRDLTEAPHSSVSRLLPAQAGRKAKAFLEVTGGVLVSSLEIDAS